VSEIDWKRFQRTLGYSDEEMENFKKDPRKSKVAEKLFSEAVRHRVIAEVVKSHGCAAGHRVGTKFVLNGAAVLFTRECPEYSCIFALHPLTIFAAIVWDRITEGVDPNGMVVDHLSCVDAGADCGGWGQIVMKVRVEKVS